MRNAVSALAVLLIPISAFAFSVHVFITARTTGHEEVTRQAIVMTKEVLNRQGIDMSDELVSKLTNLEKKPAGAEVLKHLDLTDKVDVFVEQNPIVRGNYAADKPDKEEWLTEFLTDIYARNQFPEGNMLKWGGARDFHFTLNEYVAGTNEPTWAGQTVADVFEYQDGQTACENAQNYIYDYAAWAMEALAERSKITIPAELTRGEKIAAKFPWTDSHDKKKARERALAQYEKLLEAALFRIGVATHVIQDSFSPSHTFRSPLGTVNPVDESRQEYINYDLIDVCHYDQEVKHAVGTLLDYGVTLLLQISGDDLLADEDKEVTPTYLRVEEVEQDRACAHGKVDKDDNIWLATPVQKQILFELDSLKEVDTRGLKEQPWAEWDQEIWNNTAIVDDATEDRVSAAEADLYEYCRTNRRKSSEFSAYACLKHEAKLARAATMKFFVLLMKHYEFYKARGAEDQLGDNNSKSLLFARLQDKFFYGSDDKVSDFGLNQIMPLGVMRCDRIRTPVYIKNVETGEFGLGN